MATGLSANQSCQSERLQGREHWTVFCEATTHQTIVSRRREEVRDDRREQEDRARDKTCSAADKFPIISDGEESESETDQWSLGEQDLWYAPDDKAEYEAMIVLREAREKLQHATKSGRFCKKVDNVRERVTSTDQNPSES